MTGFSDVIGSWNTIDICAPQYVAHLPVGQVDGLGALEADRALAHEVAAGEEAHDRAREHGLAGSGLADDAERLAALERERDTVDGAHEPAVGLEVGLDVGDLEEGALRWRVGEPSRHSQPALPHVEARPHDVAEEVQREHGEEDEDRRLEHDVGRLGDGAAVEGDDVAPRRRRRAARRRRGSRARPRRRWRSRCRAGRSRTSPGARSGAPRATMIRPFFAPCARAASTNSRCDQLSALAREIRPISGIVTTPIAMMSTTSGGIPPPFAAWSALPSRNALIARARTMAGTDSSTLKTPGEVGVDVAVAVAGDPADDRTDDHAEHAGDVVVESDRHREEDAADDQAEHRADEPPSDTPRAWSPCRRSSRR